MNRLRELRKENNYTLEEIADKLNITSMSLSRYERNEREPKGEILFKLSKIYNVSPDYLLGWSEIRNPEKEIKKLEESDPIFFSLYEEVKELTDEQKTEILEIIQKIKKIKK